MDAFFDLLSWCLAHSRRCLSPSSCQISRLMHWLLQVPRPVSSPVIFLTQLTCNKMGQRISNTIQAHPGLPEVSRHLWIFSALTVVSLCPLVLTCGEMLCSVPCIWQPSSFRKYPFVFGAFSHLALIVWLDTTLTIEFLELPGTLVTYLLQLVFS